MQLVVEVMLGKKLGSLNLGIILALALCGCQDNYSLSSENLYPKTSQNINTETSHSKSKVLSEAKADPPLTLDYDQVPIDGLFIDSKRYEYPHNTDFIPTYLSENNILYGEGDESSNRTALFLAAYNLNSGEFMKIADIKSQSEQASIGIVAANKDLVIYEESDQSNNGSYANVVSNTSNLRNCPFRQFFFLTF